MKLLRGGRFGRLLTVRCGKGPLTSNIILEAPFKNHSFTRRVEHNHVFLLTISELGST